MKKIYNLESFEILELINSDEKFLGLYNLIGELSYYVESDGFSFLIKTIIGQMLSNDIAKILVDRFEKRIGFASPDKIAKTSREKIKEIGISERKAEAIISLSAKVAANPFYIDCLSSLSNEDVIKELKSIRGIGAWTAKMYMIFCLDRLDVLPFEDRAFVFAFEKFYQIYDGTRDKRYIRKYCTCWGNYSSIAARYLYLALDGGLLQK